MRVCVSGFLGHRWYKAGALATRYSIYPREDRIEWHLAAFVYCFVNATSVMIIGPDAFEGQKGAFNGMTRDE
jgi:hypothetical protein